MKVRYPDILGPDVHEASFVDYPDELSDDNGTKRVLQIRATGKEPLHVESYSAEDMEFVEVSAEEEKELQALGYRGAAS